MSKKLGHDPPMASDQRTSSLRLPHPGRHRILMILGGYPPIEREPQPTHMCSRDRPARTLRPRKQQIPVYAMVTDQASTPHCHGISPLQPQPGKSPSLTTLSEITARENARRAAVMDGDRDVLDVGGWRA